MSAMTDANRVGLGAYVTLCSPRGREIRTADYDGEPRCAPRDDRAHVEAAVSWICRAQDRTAGSGLPGVFSFIDGWQVPSAEATGDLVPTLFDAAVWLERNDLHERAIRMADWLITRQFPDGDFTPSRVFSTGQIIFGLVRAWRETHKCEYLDAALRAGDWLVRNQDNDGGWRRHTLNWIPHTYNVRTAWALLQLASATGIREYRQAALSNADWAVAQQCPTGWFRQNDFRESSFATLQTIGYAMRGLMEIGAATHESRYLDAALRAAQALHELWLDARLLPGNFRQDWTSDVTWRCLPGEAQLALDWLRIDQILNRWEFRQAACDLLEEVKRAQLLDTADPDLYGGLTAGYPIDAGDEPYCLVGWGAKFLIDALILKSRTNAAASDD